MGRPTKLTKDTTERFLQGLKLGLTYRLAASYAGVGVSTVHNWIARGDRDSGTIYSEFRDAVKEAEGINAAQCMARIIKAADTGQWQASAWILERRYPADYGRRVQEVHHTGQVETGPDVSQMAEDIAKRIWERRNRPQDVE